MPDKKKYQFILASKSPRRRELLERAGFKFKIVPPEVDEAAFEVTRPSWPCSKHGLEARATINPVEYAKSLALIKAKSVAANFPESIVVGADTIVDCEGRIIGKATDAKEAEKIIRLLFCRPHKVITGLAIVRLNDNLEIVESDTTIVHPRPMTDEQIAEQIKSGIWRDKAGAYAIQEQGDRFVEKIEGSLTNVMGMPMELFERLFKNIF